MLVHEEMHTVGVVGGRKGWDEAAGEVRWRLQRRQVADGVICCYHDSNQTQEDYLEGHSNIVITTIHNKSMINTSLHKTGTNNSPKIYLKNTSQNMMSAVTSPCVGQEKCLPVWQ